MSQLKRGFTLVFNSSHIKVCKFKCITLRLTSTCFNNLLLYFWSLVRSHPRIQLILFKSEKGLVKLLVQFDTSEQLIVLWGFVLSRN